MGSILWKLSALLLAGLAIIAAGMALPLVRDLYERPFFLWASMISALVAAALLVLGPVRAETSFRRKSLFVGLAALISLVQVVGIYEDFGSPSLFVPGPLILGFFRELVHILEYGVLAYLATRLLQAEMGGLPLYLSAIAYAFIVGIVDETVQWHHAFRVGDLRDVHLNAVSALLGLLYRAGLLPAPRAHVRPAGRRLMLALSILVPLLYTEFYLRTQSGHWICDERNNCFISHYSARELAEAAADRARRWQDISRGSLAEENRRPSFWALEDYFLTEARAHFRLGNEAGASGDRATACGEIGILLRYYPPSVPAMGVRPQDYDCRREPAGFRSRAFGRLETQARPSVLRALAAATAVGLAGAAWLASRDRG